MPAETWRADRAGGACPTLAEGLVLVRSAHEARKLAAVLPQGRIVHLNLPEHEQLTMI
ncbi:hypothetical protein JCM13580A_62060 [Streptomyces drozdowiczii]|uniref:hypothetical protein n=1 Tax=Streptomyces drozdowiczii TaxID=202862 RepID=UPI0031EC12D0